MGGMMGERKQCQVCGVVQYAQNLICVNCGSQNLINYEEKTDKILRKDMAKCLGNEAWVMQVYCLNSIILSITPLSLKPKSLKKPKIKVFNNKGQLVRRCPHCRSTQIKRTIDDGFECGKCHFINKRRYSQSP